ncbi:Uncharacterised protein [Bordetella pertussis]|nr:Uncharacterised protein [Bordetella pertussis]
MSLRYCTNCAGVVTLAGKAGPAMMMAGIEAGIATAARSRAGS